MWPALLLIPLVAIYRIFMAWHVTFGTIAHAGDFLATWRPGFCPLSAVALCAGTFLPRRLALAVPLLILLVSDVVIDFHYAAPVFTTALAGRYLLLALIAVGGLWLRRAGRVPGLGTTLLATLAASTFFYVASNTLTWATGGDYPHSAAGLFQALTVGLPGYLPSWYFYRNALVSDGLYSIVFVACLSRNVVHPAGGRGAVARPAVAGPAVSS